MERDAMDVKKISFSIVNTVLILGGAISVTVAVVTERDSVVASNNEVKKSIAGMQSSIDGLQAAIGYSVSVPEMIMWSERLQSGLSKIADLKGVVPSFQDVHNVIKQK
jgi:hypothetical protein